MGFDNINTDEDSNFLRIKPESFVQFNILSNEPEKVRTHWINRKPFPCGIEDCAHCGEGNQVRKSWKMKVFDRKSNSIKEYEFGKSVADQIQNIAKVLIENHQNIKDVDLRIDRKGASLEDTEYFVMQVPKKPLPAEVLPF